MLDNLARFDFMPMAVIAVIKANLDTLVAVSVTILGISIAELINISTMNAIRNGGNFAVLALSFAVSQLRLMKNNMHKTTGISRLTLTSLTRVEVSPVCSETE